MGFGAPAATAAPAGPAPPSEAVENIIAMGFPRAEAEAALRAAFNNVDRAIEYLTTGIPEGMDMSSDSGPSTVPAAAQSSSAGATATPAPPAGGAGPSGGVSANSPLAFLAQNPNFMQLRALVHQRPNLLPSLMQQLAAQNPQLVQLINENQEDFYHLINAPPGPMPGGAPGGAPGGGAGVQVTPEENEDIERLAALGFDRTMAVQAYFACDKDMNLAATWLMEHGGD